MKSISYLFAVLITLVFAACGSDSAEQAQTPEGTPTEAGTAPAGALELPAVQGTATGTSGGGAGLNPAHGQPGHRCELAVGAPLDGSAAPVGGTTTTPVIKTEAAPSASPIEINTQPAAATQKTAAGMNPPHGQPGHRCDISVGEPLSSPVKKQ